MRKRKKNLSEKKKRKYSKKYQKNKTRATRNNKPSKYFVKDLITHTKYTGIMLIESRDLEIYTNSCNLI